MSDMHERLRLARKNAGFKTARAACEHFDWVEPTYHAHESRNRGISRDAAVRYADAFGVSVGWLITGQEENSINDEAYFASTGVGMRIRDTREHRGLAQGEVAIRAGIAQAVLSRIERGERDVKVATLTKIASAIGVSIEDLVSESVQRSHLYEAESAPEVTDASRVFHNAPPQVQLGAPRPDHEDRTSPTAVGRRIRQLRDSHGLSQRAFALRAGVSASALGNWEQGRQRPELDAASKIGDAFGVTLDFLFLGKERSGTTDLSELVEHFLSLPLEDRRSLISLARRLGSLNK